MNQSQTLLRNRHHRRYHHHLPVTHGNLQTDQIYVALLEVVYGFPLLRRSILKIGPLARFVIRRFGLRSCDHDPIGRTVRSVLGGAGGAVVT